MAKKKRTALDIEISKAQKNARNKLYRLRRRGATNTAELSPIESTAGMNGAQKAAYLRRLKRFNERSNSYVVQENNVAIPRKTLEEYRAAESEANKLRMEFRANIIKSREQGAKKFIGQLQKAVDTERKKVEQASRTGKPYHPDPKNIEIMRKVGAVPKAYADRDITLDVMQFALAQSDRVMRIERQGKFADIMPFVMKEDFASVQAAEREIRAAKEAKQDIQKSRSKYASWKEGIASKLIDNGYGDIADDVRRLSNSQMDWLHYFTEFDELSSQFKYLSAQNMGVQMIDKESLDYAYEELKRLIRVAETVHQYNYEPKGPGKNYEPKGPGKRKKLAKE